MNQKIIIGLVVAVLFLAGFVVAAQFSEDDAQGASAQKTLGTYPLDLSGIDSHEHNERSVNAENAPTIEIEAIEDPKKTGQYSVRIKTENFEFAPESVSQAHVNGEGHAHVYVDHILISRAYGEWYHIPKLKPGEHDINVSLATNDHKDYTVDGEIIQDSVTVTVGGKEKSHSSDHNHSGHH